MAKRITVVVSQAQSQHPAKRQLEEDIVAALLFEPGVDVVVIPHLYDLKADSTGMLALSGVGGNMIVLSWLYERGARWVLDRHNIRGRVGTTLLREASDDEEEDEELAAAQAAETADGKERVIDSREIPNRRIYCLDLRLHSAAQPYVDEVKRIFRENSAQVVGLDLGSWIGGAPRPDSLARFQTPSNDTALGSAAPVANGPASAAHPAVPATDMESELGPANVVRIEGDGARRWYPVIDYSRCTNCMECIDFCLFGVYGVDKVETILVEQPDNCRKGCPACSRVCPENAIIFPQHKTPAIAGAAGESGAALKIDLSKLFGAPESGETAEQIAIRERDEQLLEAGRQAVGASVGLPKRQAHSEPAAKDDLDELLDRLDELDV
jgi:NAD-dependent dihydropyrimidine dehydrogenase PreA subunit